MGRLQPKPRPKRFQSSLCRLPTRSRSVMAGGLGSLRGTGPPPIHLSRPFAMAQFPKNFRDSLRVSGSGLLTAALVITVLIFLLVAAYTVFDLSAVLPKRRP